MSKTRTLIGSEADKKEGFITIHPAPNLLLLDLDELNAVQKYESLLPVLQTYFIGSKETGRWRSKSGNTHIVVELPYGIDTASRIALQAALGSDPKREILSIGCIHSPSVLFKPEEDQ